MIKTHEGCPICHTALINGSGSSSDPKCYYTCENGHKWVEYTAIEIINDKGYQNEENKTGGTLYV